MAMYCLNMMRIALELAQHDRVYEDMATKFFEHFLYIAAGHDQRRGEPASRPVGRAGRLLLRRARICPRRRIPLRVRSIVGLIPLFAVETLEPELLDELPDFKRAAGVVPRLPAGPGALVSRWQEPGLRRTPAAFAAARPAA